MTLSRRAAALSLLGSLFILSAPAFAQDWPTKPIHFITPYPPGGSSDIITRFVADRVTRLLGQTVIVENKPGAAATLGAAWLLVQRSLELVETPDVDFQSFQFRHC